MVITASACCSTSWMSKEVEPVGPVWPDVAVQDAGRGATEVVGPT